MSLSELHEAAAADELPRTAVRVEGRVRCADPIRTADGERLALLHRDVEIQLADGRWRTIERLRDARPIDLWQRTVSVPLDLARQSPPHPLAKCGCLVYRHIGRRQFVRQWVKLILLHPFASGMLPSPPRFSFADRVEKLVVLSVGDLGSADPELV